MADLERLRLKVRSLLHFSDPAEAEIPMGGEIVVGKFIDTEKPTFLENLQDGLDRVFG